MIRSRQRHKGRERNGCNCPHACACNSSHSGHAVGSVLTESHHVRAWFSKRSRASPIFSAPGPLQVSASCSVVPSSEPFEAR